METKIKQTRLGWGERNKTGCTIIKALDNCEQCATAQCLEEADTMIVDEKEVAHRYDLEAERKRTMGIRYVQHNMFL